MRNSTLFRFLLSIMLFAAVFNTANSQTTIPAGAFIVDMCAVPQTVANELKPYSRLCELLPNKVPVMWCTNPLKSKEGADFANSGKFFNGSHFIIKSKVLYPGSYCDYRHLAESGYGRLYGEKTVVHFSKFYQTSIFPCIKKTFLKEIPCCPNAFIFCVLQKLS